MDSLLPTEKHQKSLSSLSQESFCCWRTSIAQAETWRNGMDHEFRRQRVSAREHGFTGGAAADAAEFDLHARPGSAPDRAVDAASHNERVVGGIHDRFDGQAADICFGGGELRLS